MFCIPLTYSAYFFSLSTSTWYKVSFRFSAERVFIKRVIVETDIILVENVHHIIQPAVTAPVILKAVDACAEFAAVYRHIVLVRKCNVLRNGLFQIRPVQYVDGIHIPHIHTRPHDRPSVLRVHLEIAACLIAVSRRGAEIPCAALASSVVPVIIRQPFFKCPSPEV